MATQEPTIIIENTTASNADSEKEEALETVVKDLVTEIEWDLIFLTAYEMDAIAKGHNPYFRLYVRNGNNPERVYIGTEHQDMLYGPETLTVTGWESNHSVVMKIVANTSHLRLFYTFSNIVIPGTLLRVTNQVRGEPSAMFGVRFETVGSTDQPPVQFFRDEHPTDNTLVAYYSVNSGNRQYLRPVVAPVYDQNGVMIGSRKIIQAVQDTTSDGNYFFSFVHSSYTSPQ